MPDMRALHVTLDKFAVEALKSENLGIPPERLLGPARRGLAEGSIEILMKSLRPSSASLSALHVLSPSRSAYF
jgi:hypothetical protein